MCVISVDVFQDAIGKPADDEFPIGNDQALLRYMFEPQIAHRACPVLLQAMGDEEPPRESKEQHNHTVHTLNNMRCQSEKAPYRYVY